MGLANIVVLCSVAWQPQGKALPGRITPPLQHSFSQSGSCLFQVLNHFAVLDGHHLAGQLIHTLDEHASQSFIHMVIYSLFHLVSQPTASQSLPIILAPSVLLDHLFSKSINYSHIFHPKQSFDSITPSFIQAVSMSVNLSVTALLFLFQCLVYLEAWGQSLIHYLVVYLFIPLLASQPV